jgi:hypothetical protein
MGLLVHNAGLDTGTREPSFAVGLQGLSPSDVPKVERLIMDTIEKVCMRFVLCLAFLIPPVITSSA